MATRFVPQKADALDYVDWTADADATLDARSFELSYEQKLITVHDLAELVEVYNPVT